MYHDGNEEQVLRAQHEQHLRVYDVPEVAVLERMKKIMMEKHDWEPEDFDGMSFMDIESEFLDGCGEEDFRPHED